MQESRFEPVVYSTEISTQHAAFLKLSVMLWLSAMFRFVFEDARWTRTLMRAIRLLLWMGHPQKMLAQWSLIHYNYNDRAQQCENVIIKLVAWGSLGAATRWVCWCGWMGVVYVQECRWWESDVLCTRLWNDNIFYLIDIYYNYAIYVSVLHFMFAN